MGEFSQGRLESRIMEAISNLIVTHQIKDPRLSSFASVTRVDLSVDNAYAKVYISSLDDNKVLDNSVKALNSASGYIQNRLGAILKTRNTPVLTFIKDTSYIEGEKLNKIIDEEIRKLDGK